MKKKTFKTVFIAVSVAAFLPLVFPLYRLADSPTPLVLGLPFNLFWVVLWILVVFAAVIILYVLDPENKAQEDEN